jgi:hypothetical protein
MGITEMMSQEMVNKPSRAARRELFTSSKNSSEAAQWAICHI